jgi:arsenical pump membrane protein
LLDRLPGGETALFLTAMALAAVVTALLNLDASVAFLPPVLIHLARRRGAREEPFLYGCVLMSNAASLLLPESNLTNLLVLADEHVSGSLFLARMAVTWLAAVAVTAAVDGIAFRHGKAPAYPDPAPLSPRG